MSINFPTSIDSFTNPTATNKLNNPSHAVQHDNENDAIVALETKVGVDNSVVTTSLDYKINNIDPTKITGQVPIAQGGTGQATANTALNALLPSQTGNATKILQTDGSNSSWASIVASNVGTGVVLPAAESISNGDAVCAGYYQSDGGVKFDANKKNAADVTGSSISDTLTIGSNSNKIAIAVINTNGTVSGTPTFGGSNMTNIAGASTSSGGFVLSVWYIVNPSNGSQTFSASLSGNSHCNYTLYSYYNVKQTSSIPATNSGTSVTTPVSISVTPTAIGELLFYAIGDNTGTWSFTTLNNQLSSTPALQTVTGDLGVATSATSVTVTGSNSGGGATTLMGAFTLAPATVALTGYVMQATAKSNTLYPAPSTTTFRSLFMGIAQNAASATQNVTVQLTGLTSNLSGLISFTGYYLSNTLGQLSTSAGTNSVKAGTTTSKTTELLITRIF